MGVQDFYTRDLVMPNPPPKSGSMEPQGTPSSVQVGASIGYVKFNIIKY